MIAKLVACAYLVALGLASGEVHANGRFPNANQLVIAPADPSLVVARTTFGLLVSRDRGRSFAWVCERAIGVGASGDPAIAVLGADTIAVAASDGLALASSAGCQWMRPSMPDGALIDVAAERGHPAHAIVARTSEVGGAMVTTLAETFDAGAHFSDVGGPLASDLILETVDVAPSDGDRLYVSGAIARDGALVGVVETSRDHGATWSRTIVEAAGASSVFIGAIDPIDRDRVYLRSQTDDADALLVSSDGGATFRVVTTLAGRMLGLAVSPDGRRIAIGGTAPGVLVADRDALAFEPRAPLAVQCLAWSVDGLYACGQTAVDAFVIGRSTDDGATFAPLLARLGDIDGPLASCGAGEPVVKACMDDWRALASLFGADAGAPPSQSNEGVAPGAGSPAAASCDARSTRAPTDGAVVAMLAYAAAICASRHRRPRKASPRRSPFRKRIRVGSDA